MVKKRKLHSLDIRKAAVSRPLMTALLLLLLTACASPPAQTDQQPASGPITEITAGTSRTEVIHMTTVDGVKLSGTVYHPDPAISKPNSILLLHEAYLDSQVWEPFAKTAQERGFTVLALDLRGHGQSAGEKTFAPDMDLDVDEATHWLRFNLPKENQISIIGASIGANLALRAGTRHPRVIPIIMLSPGMQLWEIGIEEAIREYGNRPLLLVAAEEDAYPFGTVNQLYDPANDTHQLEIYPGAEHGTELLDSHPELTTLLLDWIEQHPE